MLSDITLGQYFPGNSPIHKMDARVKIIWVLFYIILLFCVPDIWGMLIYCAFTAIVIFMTGIHIKHILKGLKPILLLLIFTSLINVFMTGGEKVLFSWWIFTATAEGVMVAIKMILRLVLLVMGTSILTLTTSPIMLTDGIEKLLSPLKKIKVPAHEIAMMMTIAMRFIPTILEETDKILKAQSSRGSDFETGNIIKRAKALIPVLVPLFVSAFRRADDLAVAMECRCYRGGEGRTRLRQMKITAVDWWSIVPAVLLTASVVFCGWFV